MPMTSRARRSSTCATGRQPEPSRAGESAYQLLRGLTYLQTVEGDDAGNVVLWMQPDGTLNPSADPVELPRPVRQRRVVLAGADDLGAR